jgi:hypothetical protein
MEDTALSNNRVVRAKQKVEKRLDSFFESGLIHGQMFLTPPELLIGDFVYGFTDNERGVMFDLAASGGPWVFDNSSDPVTTDDAGLNQWDASDTTTDITTSIRSETFTETELPRLRTGSPHAIGGIPIIEFRDSNHRLTFVDDTFAYSWVPADLISLDNYSFGVLGRVLQDLPSTEHDLIAFDNNLSIKLISHDDRIKFVHGSSTPIEIATDALLNLDTFFILVRFKDGILSYWLNDSQRVDIAADNIQGLGSQRLRNINNQTVTTHVVDWGIQATFISTLDTGDGEELMNIETLQAIAEDWEDRIGA